MTPEEIVEAMNELPVYDPEATHSMADDLLLEAVPEVVADAYEKARKRCRWWAHG